MSRYPTWKRVAMSNSLKQIIDIEDSGHKVDRLTDYHWKINGIDVWPSSKKYMRADKVVREYENLIDILTI